MSEHIAVTFADESNRKYYFMDRVNATAYHRGAYKSKANEDKSYSQCEGCHLSLDCPDAPRSGRCVMRVASLSGALSGVGFVRGILTGAAR